MAQDEIDEEVERRVSAALEEEGEDPLSDSDHAMYLRQDTAAQVHAEQKPQCEGVYNGCKFVGGVCTHCGEAAERKQYAAPSSTEQATLRCAWCDKPVKAAQTATVYPVCTECFVRPPPSRKMYWAHKHYTPENLCASCNHPRNSHLDGPDLLFNERPDDGDRGWCTRPEGSCIYGSRCGCAAFAEPPAAQCAIRAMNMLRLHAPIVDVGTTIGAVCDLFRYKATPEQRGLVLHLAVLCLDSMTAHPRLGLSTEFGSLLLEVLSRGAP